MVSGAVVIFHTQLDNSLYPLELMVIHLLVNYFVLKWIKHTNYCEWKTL